MMIASDADWREYFTHNVFEFGRVDANPYTREMIFQADGTISNSPSGNERRWKVKHHEFLLMNDQSDATTRFILPDEIDVTGEIEGVYLRNPVTHHRLRAKAQSAYFQDMRAQMKRSFDGIAPMMQKYTTKKQKTKGRIRIAYIVNQIETILGLLPLIHATIDDPRFEVKVIALDKRRTRSVPLGTIDALVKGLEAEKIPFIRLDRDFDYQIGTRLRNWQPDFILRQSQWDQDYPAALAVDMLMYSRLILVPYTITQDLTTQPGGSASVNDYYDKIWRYFVGSDLSDESMKKVTESFISEDIFENTGSIKAVQIAQTKPEWPLKGKQRKRLIWMAHHSISRNWYNFGSFDRIYKQMYNWTKKHPEVSVLFNPHPLLRQVISEGGVQINSEEYKQFLKKFEELENGGVLMNTSQYPAAAAADVVLTDGYSSYYEMQVLGKPIVGLLRDDHQPFTARGEQIMKGVHTTKTIKGALQIVSRLLDEPDDLSRIQKKNVADWVANKHPEQKMIESMVREMSEETK